MASKPIGDYGLLSDRHSAALVSRDGAGALLGNFPQALSQTGLVNAAWVIAQAEQRSSG